MPILTRTGPESRHYYYRLSCCIIWQCHAQNNNSNESNINWFWPSSGLIMGYLSPAMLSHWLCAPQGSTDMHHWHASYTCIMQGWGGVGLSWKRIEHRHADEGQFSIYGLRSFEQVDNWYWVYYSTRAQWRPYSTFHVSKVSTHERRYVKRPKWFVLS